MNGSFVGRETTFPNEATFSCDEGFILYGSKVRNCQSNGSWSGTKTSCQGKNRSSKSRIPSRMRLAGLQGLHTTHGAYKFSKIILTVRVVNSRLAETSPLRARRYCGCPSKEEFLKITPAFEDSLSYEQQIAAPKVSTIQSVTHTLQTLCFTHSPLLWTFH